MRVRYFLEGTRTHTRGFIKIGDSHNPAHRARQVGGRLLGTTALRELEIRLALAPFNIGRDHWEQHVPIGRWPEGYSREWFEDVPAVRAFIEWACTYRPAESLVLELDEPEEER